MRKQFATVLRLVADRLDPPFTFEPVLASTQFSGSGISVNIYGNPAGLEAAVSRAVGGTL